MILKKLTPKNGHKVSEKRGGVFVKNQSMGIFLMTDVML